MSLLKELNEIPNSPRDMRKFGITMAVILGLIAGLLFWRGREHWVYFGGAAAFFLVFGLALPGALKPIHKVWMGLALVMGAVMSRVILTVLFFLVITPLGVIIRLTGKDLLDKKPGKTAPSFWKDHAPRVKEDYENQF